MKPPNMHHCDLHHIKGHKYMNRDRRCIQRFFAKMMTYRFLWENHYRVRMYFRSIAAIANERKRHMNSKHHYIIHPCSKLSYIRSLINTIVWSVLFFHDMWIVAYDGGTLLYYRRVSWFYAIVNVYLLCDCFFYFISGHIDFKTRDVVIDQKLIFKRYLLSYFVFDFFAAIPYLTFADAFNVRDVTVVSAMELLHMLRCARIKSVVRRYRDWFSSWDVRNNYFFILVAAFIIVYQLNLFVCLLYYMPQHLSSLMNYEHTWLYHYQENGLTNSFVVYVHTLQLTVTNFFGVGNDEEYYTNNLEYFLVILMCACGYLTDCCIVAYFMTRIGASNVSESVYQQLLAQTRPFVSTNRLLAYQMDAEMNSYYAAVYGGKYFEKENIYKTLSTSIQNELMLHDCRHVFEHMQIFADLPKDIIELILLKTKKEYYLTSDVILSHLHIVDNLYLISYGTVAVYHTTGTELCHYMDGDIIAEFAVVNDAKTCTIYIAIETCEILVINKMDFRDICKKCPILKDRFMQSALTKQRRLKLQLGVEKKTQKEFIEEFAKCLEMKEMRDKFYDLNN